MTVIVPTCFQGLRDLDPLAATLSKSGLFRVLRKVPDFAILNVAPSEAAIAAIVDVETTGLDVSRDKIIELGALKFAYRKDDGRFYGVVACMNGLEDPGVELSDRVHRLTGLSAAALQGQSISDADVMSFFADVQLVVAHNAAFDRRCCEARRPFLQDLPWACSLGDVDWRARGLEGAGLQFLLNQAGYFYEGHRASADVSALLHLLINEQSMTTPFSELLIRAREESFRVWAVGAPYETRLALRERGYRWSAGEDGGLRAWFRDVGRPMVDEEVAFLEATVYGAIHGDPLIVPMTAHNRYSVRAGRPPGDGR